jgi:hypothetical protein
MNGVALPGIDVAIALHIHASAVATLFFGAPHQRLSGCAFQLSLLRRQA